MSTYTKGLRLTRSAHAQCGCKASVCTCSLPCGFRLWLTFIANVRFPVLFFYDSYLSVKSIYTYRKSKSFHFGNIAKFIWGENDLPLPILVKSEAAVCITLIRRCLDDVKQSCHLQFTIPLTVAVSFFTAGCKQPMNEAVRLTEETQSGKDRNSPLNGNSPLNHDWSKHLMSLRYKLFRYLTFKCLLFKSILLRSNFCKYTKHKRIRYRDYQQHTQSLQISVHKCTKLGTYAWHLYTFQR